MQNIKIAKVSRLTLLVGVSVVGLLGAHRAQAEDQKIEEITVTAQKREEKLQDVAVPVTVVRGAEMERRGARDLQDLISVVPNLNIATNATGPGGANIEIRGMVQKDIEKSFDTPVGVFLDGIYLATTTGQLLRNFDFDSVQVLRGPQGSLFGRNTTGGAILAQRSLPSGDAINGKIGITAGSFGRNDYRAVVNVPVVRDKLWVKVAGFSENGGGYMKDPVNPKNNGDRDYKSGSFTVRATPSDAFEAVVTYDRISDRSNPDPVVSYQTSTPLVLPISTPTGPITLIGDRGCAKFGATGPGFCAPTKDADVSYANTTNVENYDLNALTANLSYKFPDLELRSITGWRSSSESTIFDFDSTPYTLFSAERPQHYSQVSEEVRLTSNFSGPFNFVGGLSYFHNHYDQQQDSTFSLAALTAAGALTSLVYNGNTSFQDADSYAAFLQADYKISDAFKLTVGGNYSHDVKTFNLHTRSYTDGNFGGAVNGPLVSGHASWNNFSPKVTLQYTLSEGVLAYATYSGGYLSGGFNGRATNPSNVGPYKPEKVKNYEAGLKTELLDHKLIFNATIFHMFYEDRQQAVVFSDPTFGTSTAIQNIGGENINGLELETTALLGSGWRFDGSLGYLDAKYSSFFKALVVGFPVTDNRNLTPIRSPKATASAQLSYTVPVATGDLTLSSLYRFTDSYTADPTNDPRGRIAASSMVDFNIGYA
ncbi:MAG: hypothetical protein EPO08_08475, partial [Rhodospirillaceae bacterium]